MSCVARAGPKFCHVSCALLLFSFQFCLKYSYYRFSYLFVGGVLFRIYDLVALSDSSVGCFIFIKTTKFLVFCRNSTCNLVFVYVFVLRVFVSGRWFPLSTGSTLRYFLSLLYNYITPSPPPVCLFYPPALFRAGVCVDAFKGVSMVRYRHRQASTASAHKHGDAAAFTLLLENF